MARKARHGVLARLAEEPRETIQWILSKSPQGERLVSEFLENYVSPALDRDPQEGKRLAQIAVRLAIGVGRPEMARALGSLANALRALGQYEKSKKTIDLAFSYAADDPSLLALLERRRAHWWGSLGRHDEEMKHVKESIRLSREARDPQSEGRSLFHKATSFYSVGAYSKAQESLKEALRLLSPNQSASFRRAAKYLLSLCIFRSGSLADVHAALAEIPEIHAQLKGKRGQTITMERAKVWWLEALLLYRVGANAKAEELLERSLKWLLKLEMPEEIAAITADLVMIRASNREKVRKLIKPIVRSKIIFPEAVAKGLTALWDSTKAPNRWEHTKPKGRRFRTHKILEAAQELRGLFKDNNQIPFNFLTFAHDTEPVDMTPIGF